MYSHSVSLEGEYEVEFESTDYVNESRDITLSEITVWSLCDSIENHPLTLLDQWFHDTENFHS